MEFESALISAVSVIKPEKIRNICLVAHVDHGKTTLADSLISTNYVISNRMAGKLRYMDSREDEQSRGITMKSSGISLFCNPLLVNLIDSPGHVDFSGEVTSALILSDIAILLVDVIEGICSQTEILIRQIINNGQSMILVLNKIDRLCVELKMSTKEAFLHVSRLIERVNCCVSQVIGGLVLEDDTWTDIEKNEAKMHFNPNIGNVVFSSALHSYAFSCDDFAKLITKKLGISSSDLKNAMFGDFFLTNTGKIKDHAHSKNRQTIFEKIILDPLWKLHKFGLVDDNVAELQVTALKLGIQIKSKRPNEAFDELMRTWLPLPNAILRAVATSSNAKSTFENKQRLKHFIGNREKHPLKDFIVKCSSDELLLILVVKLIPNENITTRNAICRVLSGTVKPGDQLYMLQNKHNQNENNPIILKVLKVFVLRGRDLKSVQSIVCGMVCVIEAEGLIQDSTLCSNPNFPALKIGIERGEALVRVTISTKKLDQIDVMKEKLQLLSLLDTSVKILELETGEIAMITAGEVHLQKCLKDLKDMGLDSLEVSEPIVPFLETVVPDPNLSAQQILEQVTECNIRNALHIKLRVAPLDATVKQILQKNSKLIGAMRRGDCDEEEIDEFKDILKKVCSKNLPTMKGSWWYKKPKEVIEKMVENIWSFGPEKARNNILFNNLEDYQKGHVWKKEEILSSQTTSHFDSGIVTGFDIFCSNGPLCNEVVDGVAVIIEEWNIDEMDSAIAGQLMSAMKSTCSAAAEKLSLRLVAAMYRCIVTSASHSLGKVHSVLSQRKSKVLSEDINESTNLFEVVSLMPVIESFSFCDQLRKITSGTASAQLKFSHWELIDEDPFWSPSTEEEIEEFGLKGDSPNQALLYMNSIRRRKGLPTNDLIVVSAEKQRNMNKKK